MPTFTALRSSKHFTLNKEEMNISPHLHHSELRSVKETEFDLGFREFIVKFAVNKVLQPLYLRNRT